MSNITHLSGLALAEKIKAGAADAAQLFNTFRDKIKGKGKELNSFVEVYDTPVAAKGNSVLSGVPIAIKDNICIKGKRITCASKILNTHTAVYDATVIERLKNAGLRIIGTCNMDEFAFGSSTENSCYGRVKNPWDLTRIPGGSSGGSAAAVAARLVPFALGSDTGGSIRQPAALCGVVGMKPTYGRVSRFGLIAFGSSLDQIGPITTDMADCAQLLNILCGEDKHDSTCAAIAVPDFTQGLSELKPGVRIGIPKEYFAVGLNVEVKASIDEVLNVFKSKGAKIVEVTLPHTEYAVATYYIIGASEASSNLQRFDGVRYGLRVKGDNLIDTYAKTRGEGFGAEAKRRIFLGTYSLSSGYYDAYFVRALKVRRLIKEDFDKAFKTVDVILTPTSPTAAFKAGEKISDPLSMYLSDIYTISANLAGVPAVSIPCGFNKENLPIGFQLIGKAFDEMTLINLGFAYQNVTDFHQKMPKIAYE